MTAVIASSASVARPAFAHASEAELARILDFYQVRWAYEPDVFPIGWSMSGEVVESFSPDFYLPELDLYVELTTLKQKLVRKKNRKLRRLRELYPDVRIKLFYARDFRMLLLKFGRLALLDDLSGTTGQATPPRTADRIVLEAGVAAGMPDVLRSRIADEAPPTVVAGAAGAIGSDAEDEPDDPVTPPVVPGAAGFPSPSPSPARGRRRGRRRRGAASAAAGAAPSLPTGSDTAPEPA